MIVMMIFIVIFLVLILIFCLVMLALSRGNREQKEIQKRMAVFTGYDAGLQNAQAKEKQQDSQIVERAHQFVKVVAQRVSNLEKTSNFDLKMQQAAWPLLGTEFELVMLGVGAVLAFVVGILTLDVMAATLAFVGGILLCMVMLSLRIKRRQAAFANQLGDMLTMIANALRAGFSFMQALEHIATEMDDPVKHEINRVIRESSLGMPLEDSLNAMVKRMGNADFNLVVVAVLIQRQVGGSLAQILDTISETVNERIRMRREAVALTAQGRMSGVVLAALPFALGAALYAMNPNYMKPLFTEPLGRMAIGGAIISIIIGGIVINKIVNIDV